MSRCTAALLAGGVLAMAGCASKNTKMERATIYDLLGGNGMREGTRVQTHGCLIDRFESRALIPTWLEDGKARNSLGIVMRRVEGLARDTWEGDGNRLAHAIVEGTVHASSGRIWLRDTIILRVLPEEETESDEWDEFTGAVRRLEATNAKARKDARTWLVGLAGHDVGPTALEWLQWFEAERSEGASRKLYSRIERRFFNNE